MDYLHGYGGYVVTPNMFTKNVFDYSNTSLEGPFGKVRKVKVPKEAFSVDDSWFSGWLRMNKVKIYMIGLKSGSIPLPNFASNSIGALCQNDNESGNNDDIVNAWFNRVYGV